jgi:hypothetical protein
VRLWVWSELGAAGVTTCQLVGSHASFELHPGTTIWWLGCIVSDCDEPVHPCHSC